jgi:hypothetical protein
MVVNQMQQHKANSHVCCQAGKEKVLPQLLGSNADPDSNTVQQFELELQWCIQQLERALATKKMAHKHGNLCSLLSL